MAAIISKIRKIGLLAGFLWHRRVCQLSRLPGGDVIGLLAGVGQLPVEFVRAVHDRGLKVAVVAGVPGVDERLAAVADYYCQRSFGEFQGVVDFLHGCRVRWLTMLGKVDKKLLFAVDARYDRRFAAVLDSLPDRADDTLTLGFVRELRREGILVLDQTLALADLFVPAGLVAGRPPTAGERDDMVFALRMARAIGRLDIGQTVVVKNRAVMAVEAIEGTDACIRRSRAVSNGGTVVGKAAKPQQDRRFDVPTVGPETLRAMVDGGATALVIEAGQTLLVDRQQVRQMAVRHDLSVMAMT
ncbi:MAG: UDP-2,3-diacylglucosamine diphosphatase LpxI [Negativicutes bacterium]|nr:UDP-2,3-diacylglucosamine diphosphatase LpxI [Negativicutes bacterium]